MSEPMPTPEQVAEVLSYDVDASDGWLDTLLAKLDVSPVIMTRACGCIEARSWRRWWSPEWVAYRQRMADWGHAQRIRRVSYDINDALFGRHPKAGSEAARVQRVLGEMADENWVPTTDFFGGTS